MPLDHAALRPLVEKVAAARHEAYATSPRDNNDHLEAAMFVAMMLAAESFFIEQHPPVTVEPEFEPEPEPQPVALERPVLVTEPVEPDLTTHFGNHAPERHPLPEVSYEYHD